MSGVPWDEGDDRMLRRLVEAGTAGTDIVTLFPGRTPRAVRMRMAEKGLMIRRFKPLKKNIPRSGRVRDLPPAILRPLEIEAGRRGVSIISVIAERLLMA